MELNCSLPAIEQFPKDLFSSYELEQGAVIIHILASIYLFVAIAIVCDKYFVPIVEEICHIFHVPSDIGGATFMAAATSCPELFVNVVGTFVTEGDIGLGTIVGSAVFNILAVPACCGLTLALTGTKLTLDWWPLTRDSLVYGISVCLLIFFLGNERIEWYEALVLVTFYLFYIILLCFDKKIQKCFKSRSNLQLANNIVEKEQVKDLPTTVINEKTKEESNEEEELVTSPWDWSNNTKYSEKIIWIINWPINCLFYLTIPNSKKIKTKKWIPVAFVMCIAWISILTYILSWMITVIGYTLRIPDSVMGISFLAIGAGVPEAASSIGVVKKGKGAMGISNSLGSNTFDILLCLGVPWLLKSTVVSSQNWVNINSSGLQYSTITLLVTLVAFYSALLLNKFKLNKWLGLYMSIVYLIFVVIASLIELNVFFPVNPPTCKT